MKLGAVLILSFMPRDCGSCSHNSCAGKTRGLFRPETSAPAANLRCAKKAWHDKYPFPLALASTFSAKSKFFLLRRQNLRRTASRGGFCAGWACTRYCESRDVRPNSCWDAFLAYASDFACLFLVIEARNWIRYICAVGASPKGGCTHEKLLLRSAGHDFGWLRG